jgi:hypothetical protein
MSVQSRVTRCVAAAGSMLIASMAPASAFTPTGASLQNSAASPIVKVWCNWGCGPGPVVGGFVAGAVVGAAVAGAARPAYPPGYYAPGYYAPGYYAYGPGYYGPCWRQFIGPYGGVHWQRVC